MIAAESDDLGQVDGLRSHVYALAASFDFIQNGTCFAACEAGLYRSNNHGRSWHTAYQRLDIDGAITTTAVALAPANTSEQQVFAGVPGGILRSVAGGRSWFGTTLGAPPPIVTALGVSPNFTDDGTLMAATLEDGMFRSTDRGSYWQSSNFGLLDLHALCLAISPDFARDQTVFAGTESGVFRSVNGGRSWRELDVPHELAPVQSLALSPAFGHDGLVFAGTEACGLLVSQDRGATWTRLAENVVSGNVVSILLGHTFPARPDVLLLADGRLILSRDGGSTWSASNHHLPSDGEPTCLLAPVGLGMDLPVLVGLSEGGVHVITALYD